MIIEKAEKLNDDLVRNLKGVSYIGSPENNTAMYATAKVAGLLYEHPSLKECVIFLQKGVGVPDTINERNIVVISDYPQYEYAVFVSSVFNTNSECKYTKTPSDYYVGENVILEDNVCIEPGVTIGSGCIIGEGTRVLAGAVIKNCIIGKQSIICENAVIGCNSFTFTKDRFGNNIRIPSLGLVEIGDYVEIGACSEIERGGCSKTIIENYVKIEGLVHIGHESHIKQNATIVTGSVVSGFSIIGENAYLGVNALVKNRLVVGKDAMIGMGANVIRNVGDNVTVVGNPAHPLIK